MTKYLTLISIVAVSSMLAGAKQTKISKGFLASTLVWDSDNRQKLNAFLSKRRNSNKLAVFDWDNTVIKNDIGDATTFYMLRHAKLVKPRSWPSTSRHLTKDALASLVAHCPLKRGGRYLPTSTNKACATAILCIYYEGKIWDGQRQTAASSVRCSGGAAYALAAPASADTIEPGYAWTVALQAGHTPTAIRNIGRTAFAASLARDVGAKLTIGYVSGLTGYIRVYKQIKNLITTLQKNGFRVWISTASSQYIVDAIANKYVGVAADKVIGVRPVLKKGKITADFQGCGTFTNGQDIINFRQGKRCWINRIIFGIKDKSAQLHKRSGISFAAGDSDTDIFFLRDASDLRLVINRNKKEVMCNALQNIDRKWIINRMFISPKKTRKSEYKCSRFKNVLGKIIPNQRERG